MEIITNPGDDKKGTSDDDSLLGKDSAGLWVAASKVSYIGIFFGVAICIGFFFGRWLDGKWHTAPWLSLAGLMLGIATGFRELMRIAKRIQKEEEKST